MPETVTIPKELWDKVNKFLHDIDPNYVDLSFMKVEASYKWHKKKAGELLQDIRNLRNSDESTTTG